ncbi:MAG: hypothetical protein LIO77_03915 [Rikenellaceae bacterium]|nr:hypothetical protein [Rikenellaceae bacterium]
MVKPYLKVNAHLHTRYSFSAFDNTSQALDMAAEEGVQVVGINDFNTTAGFAQWHVGCVRRRLYPLFNIEMMGIDEPLRDKGLRINDPNNPGRIYISGKGLAYPVILAGEPAALLDRVAEESDRQVRAMCSKLNALTAGYGICLDANEVAGSLTKGNLRERHLARALRLAVEEIYDTAARAESFYTELFGENHASPIRDTAGIENEIRSRLLKAGGAAFFPEDSRAFLPVGDIKRIVLAAGGIPTYPFLGDDARGRFTDFEADLAHAAKKLKEWGFQSVEFITPRNSLETLEEYAGYLWDEGFIVTFGSEHNTPAMEPIELRARGGIPLTEKLERINYMGACVIAAHQQSMAEGAGGWLTDNGDRTAPP